MGAIYQLFPNAAKSKLAAWHFWLYNIGIAGFVLGLYALLSGNQHALPLVIGSTNLTLVGVVFFAINVFANVREAPRTS